MVKKIVKNENSLKVVSSTVKDFSGIPKLLVDMKDTLLAGRGVGLAAIQIGTQRRVIFITTYNSTTGKKSLIPMINPVIIDEYGEYMSYEGCLSFPKKFGYIKRSVDVCVSFQDPSGEYKESILMDEEAFIFQHEFDHLNGIICIDKFF